MIDLAEGLRSARPRLLLAASTGGHLEQLWRLASGSDIDGESLWVTFDTPQSRGLLADVRHVFVPEIAQRDWGKAARAVPTFTRLMSRDRFHGVVSTGAAIAAPALVAGRLRGMHTRYIESVSRVNGPSLTGSLVGRAHLARSMWTQHRDWADDRWSYHGSVLDNYEAYEVGAQLRDLHVFITLGTLRKYPFARPVAHLAKSGMLGPETVWQLGVTRAETSLPGQIYDFFPSDKFDEEATAADVVITHAGVGSVLRLLELGVFPILVIRRQRHGEHIDDHQAQIARLMGERGLALVREADEVTADDLRAASRRRVRPIL
jgi:UDP-N-acetylglucosamine transferase subunit ALG13